MSKHGQSTVEYAVFVVVLTAAITAMAVYIKRGMAGRLRSSADSMGEQYGPGSTQSNLTTSLTSISTTTSTLMKDQDVNGDGVIDGNVMITKTTLDAPEVTSRTGSENVN